MAIQRYPCLVPRPFAALYMLRLRLWKLARRNNSLQKTPKFGIRDFRFPPLIPSSAALTNRWCKRLRESLVVQKPSGGFCVLKF